MIINLTLDGKMNKQEQTEFEKKVMDQFMSGKSLYGKDGAFAPMLKNGVEKALEAEMDVGITRLSRLQKVYWIKLP